MSSFQMTTGSSNQNSFIVFDNWDFSGKFQTNPFHGPPGTVTSYPFDAPFNDIASSAVVVQHWDNVLQLGSVFQLFGGNGVNGLNANVDQLLTGLSGNNGLGGWFPRFEYAYLQPQGVSFQFTINYPNFFGTGLIRMDIPIRLVFKDPTPDTNADIYYYIYIFCRSDGQVGAQIVGSDIANLSRYHSSGFLRDFLKAGFDGQINNLTAQINDAVGILELKPGSFPYVMPWLKSLPVPAVGGLEYTSSVYGRDTNDDCLLILGLQP